MRCTFDTPQRCMAAGSLLGLVLGCSSDIAADDPPDPEPILVKRPPEAKDGTGTVAECGGVPTRGTCDGNSAVYCDVARAATNRVDCQALGRLCMVDAKKGAVCEGSLDDDYDAGGSCQGAVAVWRDASSGVLQRWDCSDEGLACSVDECAQGAYCCTSGMPTDGCGDLDYQGRCDSGVARWCENDQPKSYECGSHGLRCAIDECAEGAYCCGESGDECDALGMFGECTSDGQVRYCQDGDIVTYGCTGDRTCQVGACYGGAECCDPTEDECTALGVVGECNGNVARWCDGTNIVEFDCSPSGRTCVMDECAFGAYCCTTNAETCASVNGAIGICDGNTLKYCTGEMVQVTDCGAATCSIDACLPGLAECC